MARVRAAARASCRTLDEGSGDEGGDDEGGDGPDFTQCGILHSDGARY